jgi:hypothetical protein
LVREDAMNKLFGWVLGLTKVGKVINGARDFLAGKKTYVAGAALALPAILTIVQSFADQGSSYLLTLTTTPEYQHLIEGIGFITGRAALGKFGK